MSSAACFSPKMHIQDQFKTAIVRVIRCTIKEEDPLKQCNNTLEPGMSAVVILHSSDAYEQFTCVSMVSPSERVDSLFGDSFRRTFSVDLKVIDQS